jgi:mRNA interferase RelE/StbE
MIPPQDMQFILESGCAANNLEKIELTRSAEKQITKLHRQAQRLILRFLRQRLVPSDNPRQWGKPLQGEKPGLWRYRIGDYRLICDMHDEKITVIVLQVGDRRDVYRDSRAGRVWSGYLLLSVLVVKYKVYPVLNSCVYATEGKHIYHSRRSRR